MPNTVWDFLEQNVLRPHKEGKAGCLAPLLIIWGIISILGAIIDIGLFLFDLSYLLQGRPSQVEPYVSLYRPWLVPSFLILAGVGTTCLVYGVRAGKSPEIDRVSAERDALQQQLALVFDDDSKSIKGQGKSSGKAADSEDDRQ
jgi:hypothetical protein